MSDIKYFNMYYLISSSQHPETLKEYYHAHFTKNETSSEKNLPDFKG